MKKFRFLLLAVFFLSLVACQSTEEKEKELLAHQKKAFIGTWDLYLGTFYSSPDSRWDYDSEHPLTIELLENGDLIYTAYSASTNDEKTWYGTYEVIDDTHIKFEITGRIIYSYICDGQTMHLLYSIEAYNAVPADFRKKEFS